MMDGRRSAASPRRGTVIFARKPGRASDNKWTKLPPAYDFVGAGLMCGHVLRKAAVIGRCPRADGQQQYNGMRYNTIYYNIS